MLIFFEYDYFLPTKCKLSLDADWRTFAISSGPLWSVPEKAFSDYPMWLGRTLLLDQLPVPLAYMPHRQSVIWLAGTELLLDCHNKAQER